MPTDDSRYTPPAYFPSTSNGFNAANYPPPVGQQQQSQLLKAPQARMLAAPPGKRRSESEEVQPKPKKPKTKAAKPDGAPGKLHLDNSNFSAY